MTMATARTARWTRWLARLILPAALAGLAGAWAAVARGEGWLAEALREGRMVRWGLLLAACALGLQVVLGGLGRLGPVRRPGGQAGLAVLEFALIFPIALTIALVMAQTSLLMAGNLFVHYAAFSAARSAVVWIPAEMHSEPRNELDAGHASQKRQRIRAAAVWAVLPAAGAPADSASTRWALTHSETLRSGLGRLFEDYRQTPPGWLGRRLARKYAYADDEQNTVVVIAPPNTGDAYGPHENIRVTVRHRFDLAVPYANWLFDDDRAPDEWGRYGTDMSAHCTLPNQGRDDRVRLEYNPDTGELMVPR